MGVTHQLIGREIMIISEWPYAKIYIWICHRIIDYNNYDNANNDDENDDDSNNKNKKKKK